MFTYLHGYESSKTVPSSVLIQSPHNVDLETANNVAAATEVKTKVYLGKASSHSNVNEEKADGRCLEHSRGKNW